MRRVLAILGLIVAAGCMSAGTSGDALHRIVTDCLDTGDPRYCARCPDPQAGTCALDYPCTRTTQVWALNQEYVAIRDIKMCGCGASFVHGLAMPRFTVIGVEDPRRPDGIWRFAWDAARARIPEENEIALAVNPPAWRTQDQLHLHLVRLLPGARARVSAMQPIRVERLEEVWAAAAEHASSRRLDSYGVIVLRGSEGSWVVAAVGDSPEANFALARCDGQSLSDGTSPRNPGIMSTQRRFTSDACSMT
jgi:CDP-diacylglycerol pyrophosphatase